MGEQAVLPREHVDGKYQGEDQGDHNGDQIAGEAEKLGHGVGDGGQDGAEQILDHLVEAAQVQFLQVKIGHQGVDPLLCLGHIAVQVGEETLHTADELWDDEGEHSGNYAEQQDIGQRYGQRGTGLGKTGPLQRVVKGPVEKGTGPAEDKGNGEPQKEGSEVGQDVGAYAPQIVETDDDEDEPHGKSDEKQQTAEEFFVHPDTPI